MNIDYFSRFYTNETGIDCVLWITSKQESLNEPFVAIQTDEHNPESDFKPNVAISISRNPEVIASNNDDMVDKQIMRQVIDWIKLNLEILLCKWNYKITTAQLMGGLKPISQIDNDDFDYFFVGNFKVNSWYLCNFKSIHTGVDTMIWTTCKQPYITEPTIFIRLNEGNDEKYQQPNIAITISEQPQIIAKNTSLVIDDCLWQQITEWIVLNRQLLLDYWTDEDTGELCKNIKKIARNDCIKP